MKKLLTLLILAFLPVLAQSSELSVLKSIHSTVNTKFLYATDQVVYGKSDHWATSAEFIANGAGDCEDFALYKSELLTKAGIKHGLAFYHKNGEAHIAVLAEIGGKFYLSDIQSILREIGVKEVKQRNMKVASTKAFTAKYRG